MQRKTTGYYKCFQGPANTNHRVKRSAIKLQQQKDTHSQPGGLHLPLLTEATLPTASRSCQARGQVHERAKVRLRQEPRPQTSGGADFFYALHSLECKELKQQPSMKFKHSRGRLNNDPRSCLQVSKRLHLLPDEENNIFGET